MPDFKIEDLDGARVSVGALFMAARLQRQPDFLWSREHIVKESLADADAFLLAAAEQSTALEDHFKPKG